MINRVTKAPDRVALRNCIVSVANKSGCKEFIAELRSINPDVTVYSTGGTYSLLEEEWPQEERHKLINIEEFTGQPEMQGGLVKTLDFKIYTGLLSEPGNKDHLRHIEAIEGVQFDMVVVNLYPFTEIIAKDGVNPEDARSHIDIGGPCMLRAAAKNYLRVAGVCDPGDYGEILSELRENGAALSLRTRFELAKKIFSHTGRYDGAIEKYLRDIDITEVKKTYEF